MCRGTRPLGEEGGREGGREGKSGRERVGGEEWEGGREEGREGGREGGRGGRGGRMEGRQWEEGSIHAPMFAFRVEEGNENAHRTHLSPLVPCMDISTFPKQELHGGHTVVASSKVKRSGEPAAHVTTVHILRSAQTLERSKCTI